MFWNERPHWRNFYRAIEGEDGIVKYPDERKAELAIWKRMSPFAYDDPPWKPGDDSRYLETQEGTEAEAHVQTHGREDGGQDVSRGPQAQNEGGQ